MSTMPKRRSILLVLCAAASALTGCVATTPSPTSLPRSDDPVTLGLETARPKDGGAKVFEILLAVPSMAVDIARCGRDPTRALKSAEPVGGDSQCPGCV